MGSTPHKLTPLVSHAGLWIATGAPSAPHATRLWKTEANLWVWDPGVAAERSTDLRLRLNRLLPEIAEKRGGTE
jgi:hypothetical protein